MPLSKAAKLPEERMFPAPKEGSFSYTRVSGIQYGGGIYKWKLCVDTYGRPLTREVEAPPILLNDVKNCCGLRYMSQLGFSYERRATSLMELKHAQSNVEEALRQVIDDRNKSHSPRDYGILQVFLAGTTQHEYFQPLFEHYGFVATASGKNHKGTGNVITVMQKVFDPVQ